jgi:hypothetical protein
VTAVAVEAFDCVEQLATLVGVEHIGGFEQYVCDALRGAVGEIELFGAQLLEGYGVDFVLPPQLDKLIAMGSMFG